MWRSAAGNTSSAESRNDTPHDFSRLMYSGLNTRSQASCGIGRLPSAALTLSTLIPIVVMPHNHGTTYLLPGSTVASCFRIHGSMFEYVVILLLSRGLSSPPSSCSLAQCDDGTTMS